MAEIVNFVFLSTLITFSVIISSAMTSTLMSTTAAMNKESPKTHPILMRLIQNEPIINGFRAESPKHPIVIDENGLTLIPDKAFVTLRLFGTNLLTGLQPNSKIRIGFTTVDGKGGDRCDPETREFTVHEIIDNHMALVMVNLSETIRDKPYQLCYGFGQPVADNHRFLLTYSELNLKNLLQKTIKYYYLSSDNSMKIRVIGRQLAAMYRSKNESRDAHLKSKLAQIMDEVNRIHRLTDEMQEW